jgi:CYTH domain-containing protein
MAVERRFLLASSLARLLQRESGPPTRIIEGHFTPHLDRRQLVRIEQHRALLVLFSQAGEGPVTEDQVEIPRPHAEALIDAAAGIVVLDRTPVRLGAAISGVLDRFVRPGGVDRVTINIHSDPRAFAPPLWAGTDVTGDPSYETSGLALIGIPPLRELEVSNAAVEALLNVLDEPRS